jgi:hypothetical protein
MVVILSFLIGLTAHARYSSDSKGFAQERILDGIDRITMEHVLADRFRSPGKYSDAKVLIESVERISDDNEVPRVYRRAMTFTLNGARIRCPYVLFPDFASIIIAPQACDEFGRQHIREVTGKPVDGSSKLSISSSGCDEVDIPNERELLAQTARLGPTIYSQQQRPKCKVMRPLSLAMERFQYRSGLTKVFDAQARKFGVSEFVCNQKQAIITGTRFGVNCTWSSPNIGSDGPTQYDIFHGSRDDKKLMARIDTYRNRPVTTFLSEVGGKVSDPVDYNRLAVILRSSNGKDQFNIENREHLRLCTDVLGPAGFADFTQLYELSARCCQSGGNRYECPYDTSDISDIGRQLNPRMAEYDRQLETIEKEQRSPSSKPKSKPGIKKTTGPGDASGRKKTDPSATP